MLLRPADIPSLLAREGIFPSTVWRDEVDRFAADFQGTLRDVGPEETARLLQRIRNAEESKNYFKVESGIDLQRHLNALGKVSKEVKFRLGHFYQQRRLANFTRPFRPFIAFAFHKGVWDSYFSWHEQHENQIWRRIWYKLSNDEAEKFLNTLAGRHGGYVRHHGEGEFTLHEKHTLPVVARISLHEDVLPRPSSSVPVLDKDKHPKSLGGGPRPMSRVKKPSRLLAWAKSAAKRMRRNGQ